MRVDRWLWAARFFKTRSVAARAVDGGKVRVNGARVKRSKHIACGDEIRIRKPPFEWVLTVRELSERRGPPKEAARLYEESPESVLARDIMRARLRSQPTVRFEGKGRPTKRDRRLIDRLEGRH